MALHNIDEMQRAGCTTARGVRFWEEQGLLGEVARTENGTHRRYTAEQVDRARIIAAAQFGGFSLETIREMLDAYNEEVYEALLIRLSDQARAAARLGEQLPKPGKKVEYDL